VSAAKSKYYDAALSNFERARRCYVRAGLAAEWADTVCHIRASHRRKAGFHVRFEALAAGHGRAASLRFWSAPRHAGACRTRETIHEEGISGSDGAF